MKHILFLTYFCISIGSSAQTIILATDFQQGMPVNYTIVDNDGNTPDPLVSEFTSAWITLSDPENPLDTVSASTSFFTSLDSASRWMISPALSLGAFGNFIRWNAKSHDPSFPDTYLVLASATDSQLDSFTDTIGFIVEENFEWTNREINLFTQGYSNQTIYIAFVNVSLDGFKLYIDDIEVRKDDPVGIAEINQFSMFVYPNPCTDIIQVKSSNTIDFIELIDLQGTILITSRETEINIQELPAGFYLVRCRAGNKDYTGHIIKL